MTGTQAIDLPTDDTREEPTPTELQAAARAAYLQAAADGHPPTGAQLGHQFGRSGRWGRDRIAEARAGANRAPHPAASPIGNGSRPVPPVAATDLGGRSQTVRPSRGSNGTAPVATNGETARVVPSLPAGDGHEPGHRPAARRPVSNAAAADANGFPTSGAWSRRLIRWVTTATVVVVAACAARSSYEHQRTVVEMAGEHHSAWYLPLSVDGMMLIASLNMLVRRWDSERAGWLTWTALLLGGAASLAANIAAAEPTWIGRLVAAWSPVCLIVSYELLMQQLPNRHR